MRSALSKLAALALLLPGAALAAPAGRVVEVTAKRFAFDPPEVHLVRGETVTLRVTSRDVTHGLFLRPLGIDLDIQPGKTVEVTVTPAAAGRFTAICDHFCGSGHGNMHLAVVVDEPGAKEASR
jgi:cytochrome c oxidase subunit 2